MGRRKIEIKAIKDDRNRSVTFLKRKGGLFKKAYELSVLCSVDVAVIIFGQNKKLYEFSSGNIQETLGRYQYYNGPHEHKGPNDFADRGGGDDEDEEEDGDGSMPPEEPSPPRHGVVSHPMQSQAAYQHLRHTTASASPPTHNGMYPQRLSTPQPQNLSRPTSRNHQRRPSSNLVPPSQQQPSYSYQPNGVYYAPMSQAQQGYHQTPQMQQQQSQPPQQHHSYSHPHPAVSQQQQQHLYVQDQRRQSMPSTYPPPQIHQPPARQPSRSPQPPQHIRPFQSPPLPGPKTSSSKSHSIYTPIDDSRSVLAQYWGAPAEPQREDEKQIKEERPDLGPRPQSTDVGSALRKDAPQPPPEPSRAPIRTASASNVPPPLNSAGLPPDVKRPRLKVQIPEQSDEESATAESSHKESGNTANTSVRTPTKGGSEGGPHSAVVLPPPSPSASALLSAGASGPKNPFARPPPPGATLGTNISYKDNESTPMSALPSRFMADGLLPSPLSFYPEWSFMPPNGNSMASPAAYQPTPIYQHGPSFRDEDPDRKRKHDEEEEDGQAKKQKAE